MLNFTNLTIKNFMSVGNVTQVVNFTSTGLVLVLGENLDLGGQDNRNGVGKTTIVNALSYALYGKPLVNIKLENLINKSNSKGMFVTLSFNVDGTDYKIERGRKPGIFRLIKNGDDVDQVDDNEAQGENRHTQEEIERIIGISHDMFKHILALNTYVEPFLSMKAGDQRTIIEQLLGITKLSEKAEKLREEIRLTKELIKDEELVIATKSESNNRIKKNIDTLILKSKAWETAKLDRISQYQDSITSLIDLNIDDEISAHKKKREIAELNSELKSVNRERKGYVSTLQAVQLSLKEVESNLSKSENNTCPTCNQPMDAETHEHVSQQYLQKKIELQEQASALEEKISETQSLIDALGDIPALPTTFYETMDEAFNHKTMLDTLGNALSSELESVNPYTDQISLLESSSLQEINFDEINGLTRLRDHQEFLLKLLINKDSFIRKKIIDQNISLLNTRLAHYLSEIGLPHLVKFMSDLEVEISMYGKNFDFDNLSRGERTRLILSLSWAFRDVYESLYGKINLLFIDELVDQGIDTAGSENVLKILKGIVRSSGKSVYLISHKEEYLSRIDNVLKVVKENNFTTFETGDSLG